MVKPFLDMTDADWHGLLAANLHGYFHGCRAAARRMVAQGAGGRIVNISSAADVLVNPRPQRLRRGEGRDRRARPRCSRVELAGGDPVNALAPGAIDTPLNAHAYTPAVRATYAQRIAMGRHRQPDEVADVVVFLASDAVALRDRRGAARRRRPDDQRQRGAPARG